MMIKNIPLAEVRAGMMVQTTMFPQSDAEISYAVCMESRPLREDEPTYLVGYREWLLVANKRSMLGPADRVHPVLVDSE